MRIALFLCIRNAARRIVGEIDTKKPSGFLHPDGSFFVTAFRLSRGYSAIRTFLHIINSISLPVHPRRLLGKMPHRDILFIMNYFFSVLDYLTTTFVASPSTATTTIPAGAAIVTLSEAATWLAIVRPKMSATVITLPAAPCTVTAPLPAIT